MHKNMKILSKKSRFKISFAFIVSFVLIISGCSSVNKNTETGTSILWEVRPKSDTSKVAYLLGSIHLAVRDLYPLNSVIMDSWNNSNALAVEINILDLDPSSLMNSTKLINKLFSFTEKLSDKLPADLYDKVKSTLSNNGIPENVINYLTPLGAAIILSLGDASNLILNKDSNSVDGIDMYFLKKAKEESKPIYEVETLDIQISALETLNENIIPYLQSLVDGTDNNESDINKLFMAWKTGDVKMIERMVNSSFSSDKALNDKLVSALLYDRNIGMTSKIEEYLSNEETYFVVLGAGHYVGERSIIGILQKSGKYHIKRL